MNDAAIRGALANLRRQFRLVGFVYDPFRERWYALYPPQRVLSAASPLELRERLSGTYRPGNDKEGGNAHAV